METENLAVILIASLYSTFQSVKWVSDTSLNRVVMVKDMGKFCHITDAHRFLCLSIPSI
jgi:hypothetical protein